MIYKLFERLIHNNKQTKLAYLALIGGVLVQMSLGGIYSYGNMYPYMYEYMKQNGTSYNTVTRSNMMWIIGLTVFGYGASMSFGGYIEPKLGTIPTILLGSFTMSCGVLLTYWTITVDLALVAITYGLLPGLGVGIAFGVILSIPSQWFPNAKGLSTGVIVAGFGFGSILLDLVQTFYINNSIHFTGDISKVRTSFLVMAVIYSSLQLMGAFLISRPHQIEILNDTPENQYCEFYSKNQLQSEINLKPHQLLWERDFWILWITYSLNSVVIVVVMSLHRIFGKTIDLSESILTYISLAGFLCNGCGRIIWGFLNDKIAYKVLMTILSLGVTLMIGTFYICTLINDKNNHTLCVIMYSIWVMVLLFLISGNFTLFPTICCRTFGNLCFTGNYGLLFTGYSFAGMLTSVLISNLMSDGTTSIAYLTPFLVCSGLSLFSCAFTLYFRGRSLMYHREDL